jgi:hypothetical protein
VKFYWIKAKGEVEEISWEKFRELYDKQQAPGSNKRLLARLEKRWVCFIRGHNFIVVPLKGLEHILAVSKEN